MESFTVSFETLLLRKEMRVVVGDFDEHLDGNEWCLKDYVRRAAAHGYRTRISGSLRLLCSAGQQFGSAQRRSEMIQLSRSAYISQWGIARHYCVYFGKETDAASLGEIIIAILDGARQGHLFALLLHRRQYSVFRKMGWNWLHTGIKLHKIPLLFPSRNLQRTITALQSVSPDLLAVRGGDGITFPGIESAISMDELLGSIRIQTTTIAVQTEEASP